jgi:hypothetical protein
VSCPHCRGAARFVAYRGRTVLGLLGPIEVERAYYHCKACRRGFHPHDAVLGLDAADATPGAREAIALAGAVDAFGPAAEVLLERMAGLRVSESTVRRTAEAAGADVGRRLEAGEVFGGSRDWDWHRDADGATCGYVAIDATGTRQQAPDGKPAEGRMCAVAMVYSPVPEDRRRWSRPDAGRQPERKARYVASLAGQNALAEPLRRQAAQVGMDRADRWIAISDGGSGLEDWLRVNFPRVEAVILDFFHAAEYLAELAAAWHGAGTDAAETRFKAWAHRLKHEGGEAVLTELRNQDLPRGEGLRELHRATVAYFENQVHRMDYPSYVSKGWAIGSGPIEAACKTVIGRRLKGTGMRWGPEGADAMAHLRALLVGERGQWTAYWNHLARAA